jgi:1,2-diacylglycerol 3-beta-galactosyltransferase
MSDTGGGHRASAEALRAGFQELYGDKYKIDVTDLWSSHTPWPFNQLPKSYSFMVKYPFIWRANFTLTQPRIVHVPLATTASAIVASNVSQAYDKYDPDLVISVHPLMQHVPVRVLRSRIRSGVQTKPTAFATVVTDLTTCHNTWFYKGVDRCYVATDETRGQALRMGLNSDQIRLYGLPIRPAFGGKFPAKKKLRKTLGMVLDVPAVLLVGGGEGMGPVEATVDALAASLGAACQVVVVCGRNAKLVAKLSAKQYPPGMAVHVKGFVTNMPELMSACDVIVTKAGPGTISEALICGLPMVLNAFVPCQEEGNIPYVTDNGVGCFETKPAKVAGIIREWLEGGDARLKELADKAKAIAKPDALFDIVKDLAELVKSGEAAAAGKTALATAI